MWRVIPILALVLSVSVTAHDQDTDEDDWPMYGRNLHHTFSNSSSAITPLNVSTLQLAWSFPTGDAVSASPTVVRGVVYVGAWDGVFYALDARAGGLLWQFPVDCQNTVVPVPPRCLGPGEPPPERFFTDGGLITASAAVVEDTVYFAAGKTLYSVRAADGRLRWKRVICGNPDDLNCASDANDPTRIFSSPAVFEGLVFIGSSVDGMDGYRGGFLALDAETGEIRWRFEVDPLLDANGQVVGGLNRGCGNVWSSAAIDEQRRLVFFGTSDCQHDAPPPYHEAVIALETKTGTPIWVFRPRQTDTCDFDFGATPNVFDIGPQRYVGIGGKDGTYYVLQRLTDDPAGQLVWATNVVFGGMAGGFFGAAAFDGAHLFSATAIGDYNPPSLSVCDPSNPRDTPIQEPSMHAFTATSGEVRWEQTVNLSVAPTSLAAGVVLSGTVGLLAPPALQAYDARTGQLLASFQLPGSVNSGATPVGKMVFVGSGNSTDGEGSAVHAFTLPSRRTTSVNAGITRP
jgi:outer membrane protein assembly factor BamB